MYLLLFHFPFQFVSPTFEQVIAFSFEEKSKVLSLDSQCFYILMPSGNLKTGKNAFNNCVALFLAIKCSIKRNQPNQNDIITDEMSV